MDASEKRSQQAQHSAPPDRACSYFLSGDCASSARLSSRTLTRGFAEETRAGVRRCAPPRDAARPPRDPALPGDARHLELRAAGEMCGSSPDADDVTRSIGTGVARDSPSRAASTCAFTASISFLFVGPRLVPAEFAAS